MKRIGVVITIFAMTYFVGLALAADVEPTDIQQPGTQPEEVGNLESPDRCDNCHGGYDTAVEPAFNWRGSMMANAGRDPIFWATLAIAEQDFDGSGDLCIRCHSTGGWYAGRSTPTDGSGLAAGDADGVDCDTCHKMTNPDNTEHLGVMNAPFIANDGPGLGYYGSGMLSLWGGSEKLGPLADAVPNHQFMQSDFHRSQDFCGSCHDVSNPVVGDLAPNNGKQPTGDPVVASGVLGAPVDGKAAFNNFPYQYGVVERTYSEYYASVLPGTLVSDYTSLPIDLQDGAIQAAYQSAGGNYADGTERTFTCQTCHMQATTGPACNKKGAPIRTDLPLHDMTGGNYWMPDAIQFQDANNTLRLGGGLSSLQIDALNAGKDRARQQLDLAAALSVTGNTLKVTNLTGHKLISGYPEGRRMWLNIEWYDENEVLLREDGAYGNLDVDINGTPTQVQTILDLHDPNTKIYEAHYGMTQDWAAALLSLGYASNLPLSYDRVTGATTLTLGQLAAGEAGTAAETFHFVLNNSVLKDNRIPPYGFSYDEARVRNALPVPADQYGGSGAGSTYYYWDEVELNPPDNAESAEIYLMYQPTSWEYIQFLYLANNGQNEFLGQEGVNMLDAWLHTGMAEPHTMATATWGAPPSNHPPSVDNATFSADEFATNGTTVGTVTYSDPDSGQNHTCKIHEGNTDNAFAIDSDTCQITVNNSSALDYTTNPSFDLTVRVTDDGTPARYGDGSIAIDIILSPPTCYALTLSSGTGGGDPTASPTNSTGCSTGEYIAGENITLTAHPNSGYQVASWSGTDDDTSTSNTNTLTMPASAATVSVTYEEIPPTCYTLTLSSGAGGGNPTASPTNSTGCAAGEYVAGESITLTAHPDSGFQVASWSGTDDDTSAANINSLTMPASAATVSVAYEEIPPTCYALTLLSGASGGDPTTIPTNSTGCAAGEYVAGESIALTAHPDAGYQVASWSGTDDDTSTANTNILTMPASAATVSVTYAGDITNPEVDSITLASANPTSAATVYYSVTFSEPVNNVDIADFTITATGSITGYAVTDVSPATGPAAVYTVTVTTGAYNGTLTLNVVDNGTIQDTAGNPLASGYTDDEAYTVIKTYKTILKSQATYDGWIRESSEISGKGGTKNNTGKVIYAGDDAYNRQYRSILSFNTAGIPDNAVVTKVILKIKKAGLVGTNPLKTHGDLYTDIRKNKFGTSKKLQFSDFQASASKNKVGRFKKASSGWYKAILGSGAYPYVKLNGTTQFRVRFAKDDNNDFGADYLKFYSGNAGSSSRPQLIVEYIIP